MALLLLAGSAPAQRFDNWIAAPVTNLFPFTNMVTHPATGAPAMLVLTGTGNDTATWDGTSFVSLGVTGTPTPVGQPETLAPFVAGTTAGLVHLDLNGATSVLTGAAWTALGVLTPSPSPRTLAAASTAVDQSGNAFVFGGSGTTLLNDLWSFNGTAWTNITPGGNLPPARMGATLTADRLGGLILYGGTDNVSTIFNDVWRFNGSAWTFLGKAPVKRAFHTMLLDISRHEFVVVGGVDPNGPLFDFWTLPLPPAGLASPPAGWNQIAVTLPFTNPTGLVTGALDGVRNELVVADQFGFEVINDRVASFLVRAQSTASATCVVPNLQIIGPGQPLVPASPTAVNVLPMGGILGVAGAPMLLAAEFAVPGIGFPLATPIPPSTCLSFLSPAAQVIATTTSFPSGAYLFNLLIPGTPSLVGQVIDAQAFGATPIAIAASPAVRIVLGR
jgi:hypothetical protein